MPAAAKKAPTQRTAQALATQRQTLRLIPAGTKMPGGLSPKERFLHVPVGDTEVAMLYQLIEYDGLKDIAKAIGISDAALLRVCAGMFHHCKPKTQHAVRRFFAQGSPS